MREGGREGREGGTERQRDRDTERGREGERENRTAVCMTMYALCCGWKAETRARSHLIASSVGADMFTFHASSCKMFIFRPTNATFSSHVPGRKLVRGLSQSSQKKNRNRCLAFRSGFLMKSGGGARFARGCFVPGARLRLGANTSCSFFLCRENRQAIGFRRGGGGE